MADVKISDMTLGTLPLAGTELFEMTQSGGTVSVEASDIAAAYITDPLNILRVANGGTGLSSMTANGVLYASGTTTVATGSVLTFSGTAFAVAGSIKSSHATLGIGYATGAGATVTQATNRTTGVTINAVCGAITLFSAAGSATATTFTVSNSAVAATDTIVIHQKSGTDLYNVMPTAVGAGSFNVTFFTTGGTTVEQPVFTFSVLKGVTS